MWELFFTGWHTNAHRIELVKLVRDYTGLDLKASADVVFRFFPGDPRSRGDPFLSEEPVAIQVSSEQQAHEAAEKARRYGAICEVRPFQAK